MQTQTDIDDFLDKVFPIKPLSYEQAIAKTMLEDWLQDEAIILKDLLRNNKNGEAQ